MRGALFMSIAMIGCARPSGPVKWTDGLPELSSPIHAGALERGEGFVRREYTLGGARISVTLAAAPITDDGWANWVRMSASYPPAKLPARASGFYDCRGDGAAERCDLHAQLRSGFHLELFANGTATRADLDSLVAQLPLERWTN